MFDHEGDTNIGDSKHSGSGDMLQPGSSLRPSSYERKDQTTAPNQFHVPPVIYTSSHKRKMNLDSPSKKRLDRISGSVSKRIGRINSSCPIPIDASTNITSSVTPHKRNRDSRMYVDLVTPRATPRVVGHKKLALLKGDDRPLSRVPLADKSVPNTPRVERKTFVSVPAKNVVNGIEQRISYRKPLSGRSSLSKGLAPSPAQRNAPQTVEVIDLDSDGETSSSSYCKWLYMTK